MFAGRKTERQFAGVTLSCWGGCSWTTTNACQSFLGDLLRAWQCGCCSWMILRTTARPDGLASMYGRFTRATRRLTVSQNSKVFCRGISIVVRFLKRNSPPVTSAQKWLLHVLLPRRGPLLMARVLYQTLQCVTIILGMFHSFMQEMKQLEVLASCARSTSFLSMTQRSPMGSTMMRWQALIRRRKVCCRHWRRLWRNKNFYCDISCINFSFKARLFTFPIAFLGR
mmetsp:Transcript_6193/g.12170  ORF Transcript_6193/g.12170 Transcript_6193/m.12170 type:complete len:226 (+) Transcript_6193:919-1596(+)